VDSCEDRRDFWNMLKTLAGVGKTEISRETVEAEVRRDVVNKMTEGLLRIVTGSGESLADLTEIATGNTATAPAATSQEAADYMAPWIDTDDCTACDECTQLNSKIFVYNDEKKAVIKDPDGGPYRDLVKAAEKCTARVIHPGLPRDRSDKDADKWIERAKTYNG
jgi:pyruvate-ferredoxin/flavodoxin oxidoreductase